MLAAYRKVVCDALPKVSRCYVYLLQSWSFMPVLNNRQRLALPYACIESLP